MRMVKKTWFTNNIPHQKRIDYRIALNELQGIYLNASRELIDEKLSQGTKLGDGKGKLYQVIVIKKEGKEENKMKKEKNNWENKKTVWIDKDLHTKLKTLASQSGMKMGIFVEGLINKSLKKEGEKKNA